MAAIDGWVSEHNQLWPGQKFSLEVEEVLHHEKSQFQDILIFQSKTYGRVLVLDGIFQCTDKDEFAYHETLVHVPLFSHPNPQKVLVVGGGDGGAIREVAKHSTVEEIHICEIDECVIELSKKYLPQMAVGYSNPKVKVHVQDGNKFMDNNVDTFDVIITDSSDPIGPATCLFEALYFEKMCKALRPNGIICSQGQCFWTDLDVIHGMLESAKKTFPVVSYASSYVSSYPNGQIGYVLASRDKDTVFERPLRQLTEKEAEDMNLRYYDSDIHRASFSVPRFVKKRLGH